MATGEAVPLRRCSAFGNAWFLGDDGLRRIGAWKNGKDIHRLGPGRRRARGARIEAHADAEGQVELLKAKGVTFDRCSEEQAIEALSGRDTFLHTAAYRKLFQVHREGGKAGQYVKLDFADLLDLDALDGRLRRTFLAVTGDIERIAKTRLIARLADDPAEDGYGIVSEFMQGQRATYRNSIARGLKARAGSSGGADTYSGNLIEHYRSAMPVWVFLEVVPFGTLLAFLLFCAEPLGGDKALENRHYELTGVKAGAQLLRPSKLHHKTASQTGTAQAMHPATESWSGCRGERLEAPELARRR